MSAYTPPKEPNFIQKSLSSFLKPEKLNSAPIPNGKLSQKDEILFIFSLVAEHDLTKEETYEIIKFVEHILDSEVIYGIPNQVVLSNLLRSLKHSKLIIQYDKMYKISQSGINTFKNSFQKSILKQQSLRSAFRFLNTMLPALLDKNPDIMQLKIVLQQAKEFYNELSG